MNHSAAFLRCIGMLVCLGALLLFARRAIAVPLVAYYTFENGADLGEDGSSSGNDATVQGTPVQTSAAKIGSGAIELDGFAVTPQFLQLPNISGDITGESATLAMWIRLKTHTPGNAEQTGFDQFGTAGSNSHYPFTDGLGYFTTFRADRVNAVDVTTQVPDRTVWHHLAITTEPGANNYVIYQDGQPIRTENPNFGLFATPKLGQSASATRNLDGFLDDAALINEALSAAEVAAVFSLGDEPDLEYSLEEVNLLLEAFENNTPQVTIDDVVWNLITDGSLSSSEGFVTKITPTQFELNLGGGNGFLGQVVPEPATAALLSVPLAGWFLRDRRRRRN